MYKLIFFLTLFISQLANAQDLNLLKSFPLENQLSYQFVRTIAQDNDGFMWFGSQEGLYRYDGHQFLNFHNNASDQNSLSSDVISRILIDEKSNIWIATRGGGLNLYREKSNDFKRINSKSGKEKITDDNINAILEDKNGNIWVGTEDGLNIMQFVGGSWEIKHIRQELGNSNSLSNNMIHALMLSKDGNIWVGTNGGGISVFDLEGRFIKQVKFPNSKSLSLASKLVNSLFQDKKDNIWIGTVEHGLIKYNPNTEAVVRYQYDTKDEHSISSNTLEAIYQDSTGKLWVGTDKGLLIYNEKEDNFWRFNHSIVDTYSLSSDYILTFFEDSSQTMWIGTYAGVNRWNPNLTTFNQYNGQSYPTLKSNNVSGFAQSDENFIFFSTYNGGVYRLSTHTNEITQFKLEESIKDIRIMSLLADKEYLWVGTRSSGLYKINIKTHVVKHFIHNTRDDISISANSITDIIKDKQGNLWVATYHNGINRLNFDETFTRYTLSAPATNKGPNSKHVLQIMEDRKGYIWLATYGGGLNRYDPSNETFKYFLHDDSNAQSISSDLAYVLFYDKDDNLWVGTQTAGLNVLSKENQLQEKFDFEHLNIEDGMRSGTTNGISQDLQGNIWFSSNKGITRYSPRSKHFKNFDTSHGLRDLEYNHSVVHRSFDGTLYFGSAKGFLRINPENINNNQVAPKVNLTNILKLNEPMLFDQSLSELGFLLLDYSDQLITFEYVGLNYTDPESTRYKYRLHGFDQEWIDAGKSRRATYTNLPSGNYRLEVIAANNDNIWSEPGLSLDITVKPAPWNTWWAYVLYAVFIALLLLTYSRFLNRKLLVEQQQKQFLKRQVKEKTQEFHLKNIELEKANQQLEDAATVDKVTGVKSRRYLDIYIEQASQLMSQIHENILPVQRNILPRLYLVMVKIDNIEQVTNSQLVDLTDLLLYSRNNDDLVIRWAEDIFIIIGYEKDDNVRELVIRLTDRFAQVLGHSIESDMAYSFYPFNFEQPMALSWDQVSVLTEHALKVASNNKMSWLGFYAPQTQPFNYLDVIQQQDIDELSKLVKLKQG
jgi:ligand-binding sensor domain-containing protein/GGDEF domain-containing protein